MATRKHGLGKGLNALLGDNLNLIQDAVGKGNKLYDLALDRIQRGQYQPRTSIKQEELEELAASIRAQGLIQPIVVRPIGSNKYEIIAGERRWRAAQMAGLHDIPAIVRDVDDQQAMAMALIENIQRQDLNPLDEANALFRLVKEFQLTHQQTADAVGRSRAAVSNMLRLLELSDGVKTLLADGALEMGHARALLAVSEEQQLQLAAEVVRRQLSVRQTEQLVRKSLSKPTNKKSANKKDADICLLEEQIAETLGALVTIQQRGKSKGNIIISYNSLDELDGIIQHLK